MNSVNSNLLGNIGLGNVDIGYILLGMFLLMLILSVLLIVMIVRTNQLKKRLDKFFRGKNGSDLEKDIIALFEENKFLKINADKNKKEMRILSKKVESAFQKMSVIKYDAFNQMGGQLSFCLCLLDDNNNGFIINSVHSTEGCYSYTKEIKAGESELPLGVEEEEALSIALGEQ